MKVPVYIIKDHNVNSPIVSEDGSTQNYIDKRLMDYSEIFYELNNRGREDLVFSVYSEHFSKYADKDVLNKYGPITIEMFHENPMIFGMKLFKDKNGKLKFY